MRKKYFNREKCLLRVCGLSLTGDDSIAYKTYSFFTLICFNFGFPLLLSGEIFKHDFIDSARAFLYCITSLMAIIMTLAVLKNRKILGELLNKLEDVPFRPNPERGGYEEEKLIEQWVTFKNQGIISYASIAIIGIVFGFGYALVQRIMYSDPQKWILNYGPLTILNVTYSPNYEITLIYQTLSAFTVSMHIITIIVTLSGILAFTSAQFEIIQNNLRKLVEHSHEKSSQLTNASGASNRAIDASTHSYIPPPWKYLQSTLAETVSHHLKIFELISELENIFNVAMLAIYLSLLCIFGFIMYIMSVVHDIRTIKLIVEAGSVFLLALMICYWGERTADESQKVAFAAYETNFVGTDLRFQKALVIIMQRSQPPTRIKAGYMIETSLVTFAWILKTSYSCFMLLRSTSEE